MIEAITAKCSYATLWTITLHPLVKPKEEIEIAS
jgi:hypothetical protein